MDFEKLKEFRNSNNPFGDLLNMRIVEITKGSATAELIVGPEMKNPQGSVHGGSIYSVADIAGSAASSSHGYHITTLDSSFHFLRPAMNPTKLIAKARELKAGKRVMVYDITVSDQDGQVLAEGIFTYMSIGKEIQL